MKFAGMHHIMMTFIFLVLDYTTQRYLLKDLFPDIQMNEGWLIFLLKAGTYPQLVIDPCKIIKTALP